MKYKPGESIENWAERVRMHEYGEALKQIASGQDVNVVMEAMSVRIMEKIKHPLLKEIKDWGKSTYDATLSKENYKKNYLDKTKPVADHMNDVIDPNHTI
jgi:glutamyl-tRNA reductase